MGIVLLIIVSACLMLKYSRSVIVIDNLLTSDIITRKSFFEFKLKLSNVSSLSSRSSPVTDSPPKGNYSCFLRCNTISNTCRCVNEELDRDSILSIVGRKRDATQTEILTLIHNSGGLVYSIILWYHPYSQFMSCSRPKLYMVLPLFTIHIAYIVYSIRHYPYSQFMSCNI